MGHRRQEGGLHSQRVQNGISLAGALQTLLRPNVYRPLASHVRAARWVAKDVALDLHLLPRCNFVSSGSSRDRSGRSMKAHTRVSSTS
jgi:hypothetical protein